MDLAATVLAEFAPDRRTPESVRSTGERPWQRTVPESELVATVRGAVEAEAAALEHGTIALLTADPEPYRDLPVEVHTPVSAKGLEFDVVVIADPAAIRAANPADLYVSITRATQRLGLVHVAR
jgi:superfamily I DNA/RNA helicase